MSDHLARTVAEVARRLAGDAIEDGRKDGGRYDLGSDHGGAHHMARATVVSGRIGKRPHAVNEMMTPADRRVRSGDAAFDDRFRVEHEAGAPPDDLLARPDFRAPVNALAPFEEIAFGNGIVRFVTLYDSESLSPDDVFDRVASLESLAVAASRA